MSTPRRSTRAASKAASASISAILTPNSKKKEVANASTSKGPKTAATALTSSIAAGILSYKYVSPSQTLTERLFLVRFWKWTAEFYPRWLAPNTITLLGFAAALIALVGCLVYSPSLDGSTPAWWAGVSGLCIFFYQTMDGTDGMQARRLGCGSPLGELVDHGIDSLIVSISAVLGGEMISFPVASTHFANFFFGVQVAFYTSNMVLLTTGRQHFNDIDAQESLLGLAVFGLVTFVAGKGVWRATTTVPYLFPEGVEWVELGIWLSYLSIGRNILVHLYKCSGTPDFRNLTSTIFLWVIFGAAARSLTIWNTEELSECSVQASLLPWLLVMIIGFGDLSYHLLVARVAKQPVPSALLSPGILMVTALLLWELVTAPASPLSVSCDAVVAGRWVVAVLSGVASADYVIRMGIAIRDILGVQFFTVPADKQQKQA